MFMVSSPVEALFPTIEDIKVEFGQTGYMLHPLQRRPGVYTKDTLDIKQDCRNKVCHKGGFSLRSIITKMVLMKETSREIDIPCNGFEGSLKNRRMRRDCLNSLELKITIKYKEASE